MCHIRPPDAGSRIAVGWQAPRVPRRRPRTRSPSLPPSPRSARGRASKLELFQFSQDRMAPTHATAPVAPREEGVGNVRLRARVIECMCVRERERGRESERGCVCERQREREISGRSEDPQEEQVLNIEQRDAPSRAPPQGVAPGRAPACRRQTSTSRLM